MGLSPGALISDEPVDQTRLGQTLVYWVVWRGLKTEN